MTAGLKAWRRRAKVVRTERAPRGDGETAIRWCEACRYMHRDGECACRHDFRDGDVCSKCDAMKESR